MRRNGSPLRTLEPTGDFKARGLHMVVSSVAKMTEGLKIQAVIHKIQLTFEPKPSKLKFG